MTKSSKIFKILMVLAFLNNGIGVLADAATPGSAHKDLFTQELEVLNVRCKFTRRAIKIEVDSSLPAAEVHSSSLFVVTIKAISRDRYAEV